MPNRKVFPAGGGEMGAAVRARDWSASALGPIQKWPTALRNALNLMLNSPESMYLVWGPELTFFFNDAYRPILGPRLDGALGASLPVLWHDAWDDVWEGIDKAFAGDSIRYVDLPITMTRYGVPEETYWSFSYSPIYDGDSVAGIFCYTIETTARIKATRQLRASNAALEQQVEARTAERNRLWDLSSDLLGVADDTGRWLSISPSWTETLGWDAADIVGKTSAWMEHPDDHDKTRAEVASLAAGNATLTFENRFRTRAGGYRTLSWRAVPEGGLFYCVARDVSEAREQAAALVKAEEQLRQSQKMEAVGQLTGGLAHDFNNLLAGISGSLELMNTRISQGRLKDVEKYMVAAQGATKRAAALTHRLLAFSRQQTLSPKATDVNTLVGGMLDLIERTVGPGIVVQNVGASGLWAALVDPSQLENALLNLCINARDAMPEGGQITIETGNRWIDRHAAEEHDLAEGQYLSLCVSDTGTGMSPEVVAKAFDPFFTTKPLGRGTGLGLSMIYGFAKQSGGQVRIHSEVGEGTDVCIYLPLHRGQAEHEQIRPEAAAMPVAETGETVLIVDDEPTVRMLVTDVLEELGYTAIEASDSAGGLNVLRSDARIDLLVTDVGLPGGMNGRQMADAARAGRPDLKVLFITGFAENALLDNGQLEPGMSVLTKPFAVDTLAARIRELIMTQQRPHQRRS